MIKGYWDHPLGTTPLTGAELVLIDQGAQSVIVPASAFLSTSADFIATDGSSVTTASIPLEQGITVGTSGQFALDNNGELTQDWDAGSFAVKANTFTSDVATGTAPFTVTSTTVVTNLNSDMVDGKHVGASGNVIPLLDQANTWSADQTYSSGVNILLGTIGQIRQDGANLIINSTTAATPVVIGTLSSGVANGRLLVDYIGLSTVVNTQFWINFSKTTSAGRGALQFAYTYTGTGPTLNILSVLRFQGSATNATALSTWQQAYLGADPAGAGTIVGMRSTVGFDSTSAVQALTAGGTVRMFGLWVEWSGNGTTHTAATIYRYGLRITPIAALTLGGAVDTIWGINCAEDIQIYDDKPIIFGGSDILKGTNYLIYNSGTADMTWFVNANLQITVGDGLLGFFGGASVAQPIAGGVVSMPVAGGPLNPVFDNSGFDGGVGGSAYTIDDVVLGLKQLNLLAA